MSISKAIRFTLNEAAALLGLDIGTLTQVLHSTGISKVWPASPAIGDATLRVLYRKITAS